MDVVPLPVQRFNGKHWEDVVLKQEQVLIKSMTVTMWIASSISWRSDHFNTKREAVDAVGLYLTFNDDTWRVKI